MILTTSDWIDPDRFLTSLLDLRSREREVLGLRAMNGFSVREVAELLRLRPGSVSSHYSKATKAIGKALGWRLEGVQAVLEELGEGRRRRFPTEVLEIEESGRRRRVEVCTGRYVLGGAVRTDGHLTTDTIRYFITRIDGKAVSMEELSEWLLSLPIPVGMHLLREILALRGTKCRSKFDRERCGYFWPLGFGSAELYFDRDFDHEPELTIGGDRGYEFSPRVRVVPDVDLRRGFLSNSWWVPRTLEFQEFRREHEADLLADLIASQWASVGKSA